MVAGGGLDRGLLRARAGGYRRGQDEGQQADERGTCMMAGSGRVMGRVVQAEVYRESAAGGRTGSIGGGVGDRDED